MCHTNNIDELHIWKDARNLVKEVYYQSLGKENNRFCGIFRRAALSVLSNIAEGYGSGSPVEFKAFLHEAAGCCNEIRNLLNIARTHNYLEEEGIEKLMQSCNEMVVELRQMIRRLGQQQKR